MLNSGPEYGVNVRGEVDPNAGIFNLGNGPQTYIQLKKSSDGKNPKMSDFLLKNTILLSIFIKNL